MEKGGGGRYEDAKHHGRNGNEQTTVEEAHIPSNPIIGSKWTLDDDDDDDDEQCNASMKRWMESREGQECHRFNCKNYRRTTLTFGSETWTWNEAQQSSGRALEMGCLGGACGVTIWEGESEEGNESVCERCGMNACANGGNCRASG